MKPTLKYIDGYTIEADTLRQGMLFYRPKMLSDDILSSWIGGSQCSNNLKEPKSCGGLLFVCYHKVLVQILNGARNGCSRRLKQAQDQITASNLQNSSLSTVLRFQCICQSLQTQTPGRFCSQPDTASFQEFLFTGVLASKADDLKEHRLNGSFI